MGSQELTESAGAGLPAEAGLHAAAARVSAWSGGGSPFAMGSKKLGMWLFIVSDAITFSAMGLSAASSICKFGGIIRVSQ